MDAIPTPNPTNILPRIIIQGAGAAAMITAPMKNSTSATKIDSFLPNLSFAHPPNAAPIMAPATAILTMVSCTLINETRNQNQLLNPIQGHQDSHWESRYLKPCFPLNSRKIVFDVKQGPRDNPCTPATNPVTNILYK